MNEEISLFLSKVIGFALVIFAVGLFSNLSLYVAVTKRIAENPILLFIVGWIDLILGLLIVFTHNDWANHAAMLVSLIGWLLLIRGSVRLILPRQMMKIAKKMNRQLRWLLCLAGIISLCYGSALLYFSFF